MWLDAIQDQLCEIAPSHNIRSPVMDIMCKCQRDRQLKGFLQFYHKIFTELPDKTFVLLDTV